MKDYSYLEFVQTLNREHVKLIV